MYGLHNKFRWQIAVINTIAELLARLESLKHVLFKDQFIYLLLEQEANICAAFLLITSEVSV